MCSLVHSTTLDGRHHINTCKGVCLSGVPSQVMAAKPEVAMISEGGCQILLEDSKL